MTSPPRVASRRGSTRLKNNPTKPLPLTSTNSHASVISNQPCGRRKFRWIKNSSVVKKPR